MVSAAKILDQNRFEARARIGDVLALGLLLVVGGALLFNMYQLGSSAQFAAGDAGLIYRRDRDFVNALIEMAIVVLSFAWIAYRLFSRSARRSGG